MPVKKLWKTCYELSRGHHLVYVFSLLSQILMVFCSVFSTFLIKVLLDTLGGLDELLSAPFFEQWVITILTQGRGPGYLIANQIYILPVAVVSFGAMTAIASFLRMSLRSYAASAINCSMQLTVFFHLESVSYPYFKKAKGGDLIQTCTRDLDVIRKFMIADLSNFNYTIWMVLFCFLFLLGLSWELTLVSMALFPVMFIYSFLLIKEVRKRYRKTDDSEARMTDRIQENIGAVRLVKAFNSEKREVGNFENYLSDFRKNFISWRKMSSFFFASTDILVFGAKLISLIYGIYLASQGIINPGTLVVSFLFVNMMVWPIRDTAMSLSNLGQYLASIDRIRLILDEPLEDLESGLTPSISGHVVFNDVSFHFPDGDKDAISHVSFEVKAGQTVAIMGKTGAGKSTLALLLTRLYETDSGSIKIDDYDIKTIQKHHLRKNVVPILQDPFLFSKSISENILMANQEADLTQLKLATRVASIDETIANFKDGYETQVGEKGMSLSGGQKQRVAIARGLIAESPIIIFDDSLSAVDTETDLKIRRNLSTLERKFTTFIITHRVSTAKDADLIIVLEDGKVSEMGTHQELLLKPGLYKRIAEIQGRMV